LTVMAGGDDDAFRRVEPMIASYARMVTLIGPAGSGQLTKMVNQIAVAGVVQGLAEAIAFAEHAALDVEAVMKTISKGAAQSWQMENRWRTMHDRSFDFGFAVDWMRKDLGICLAEAERNGARLDVTRIITAYYEELQRAGAGRLDTSSLIKRLG
jgi:3-hydroxyisobutyrate dehydrogenase